MFDRQRVRKRLAVVVHSAMAAALIPTIILFGRPDQIRHPALLGVLILLCWLGEATEVKLITGDGLDATTAIALVVLVLEGPLIAFAVMMSAIVAGAKLPHSWFPRETKALLRPGNLSNFASYGWALLGAWAVLRLGGSHHASANRLPLVFAAGILASWGQAAVGNCIHEPLYNGIPLREFLKAMALALPVDVAMVALGSITAVLVGSVGSSTVLILVSTVCLPAFVPAAAEAHPISELSALAATERFALAIATLARLPATQRRLLRLILDELADQRMTALRQEVATSTLLPVAEQQDMLRGLSKPAYVVWMVQEPWSASEPARSERIPMLARIIAVAQHLAILTARGGPELPAAAALRELQALAGVRYDPTVVDAARWIVVREQRFNEAVVTCARFMGVVVDAHKAVACRVPQPSLWRVWIASRLSPRAASGLGVPLIYAAAESRV
jgi:hypothetical protein